MFCRRTPPTAFYEKIPDCRGAAKELPVVYRQTDRTVRRRMTPGQLKQRLVARQRQRAYAEALCRPKSRNEKFSPVKAMQVRPNSRETCFTGLHLKKMQAGMPF